MHRVLRSSFSMDFISWSSPGLTSPKFGSYYEIVGAGSAPSTFSCFWGAFENVTRFERGKKTGFGTWSRSGSYYLVVGAGSARTISY